MELVSQAYPVAMMLAFLLGALSFFSPCVLPIVPPYLAYMSGIKMNEIECDKKRGQLVASAAFFVLGLSTVFLILALAVNRLAGQFLASQSLFNLISGTVIILFGLHFLGVFRFGFLEREMRMEVRRNQSPIGAYVLGLAFALGWSPCLGPALSAILSMIASEENLGRGMFLMGIYALGLGLPFLIAALLIEKFMRFGGKMRQSMPIIEKAMGVLLILVGLLMISGNFSALAFWLLDKFPVLARIG